MARRNNTVSKKAIRLFRRLLSCRRSFRPIHRKIVMVGDAAVGKTALLSIHTAGTFPDDHEPTIFDNYLQETWVDGDAYRLSLVDTAGQEALGAVRSLSYADTHVVILCFSVDRPETLANAMTSWSSELAELCPGVAILLLATKCDLREDPTVERRLAAKGQHPVTYEEGLRAAHLMGAQRYLECSAMHDIGVNEIFEQAARAALDAEPRGVNIIREQKMQQRRSRGVSRRLTKRISSRVSWFGPQCEVDIRRQC
ncbi:P-loop containing nucleoside triphosphate hydrolase protein [Syncephalis plumigaleata]|nr:P-loop containing nucleoside triphosphate hydrolase protein [Syncephalis plumigaleata]